MYFVWIKYDKILIPRINFCWIILFWVKLIKLDQETWLVPDPIGWLFGQNLDYFRPYKN